jgi:hypothetical protein
VVKPSRTISGEYEILERLGLGGMGEVFLARHRGPSGFERHVVLKRILPHLMQEQRFVEMFLSEARLSAQLDHPNIVHIFHLGHDQGEYFLVMEYVAGRQLSDVIDRFYGKVPPAGLGALVVRDIARALAYAYELPGPDGAPLRLVHRDVSPSNIMVGQNGNVKLLDFGVAKSLSVSTLSPPTQSGMLMGKLWYMAPERLAGAPFDHRADLFAAGVVLYEALTGCRLFDGESLQAVARMMEQPIPPASRSNPDVTPALDAICVKALQPDPEQRFASGRELAAALDEVLFELRWGAEQLATTMKALFPPGTVPAASDMMAAALADTDTAPGAKRPNGAGVTKREIPGTRPDAALADDTVIEPTQATVAEEAGETVVMPAVTPALHEDLMPPVREDLMPPVTPALPEDLVRTRPLIRLPGSRLALSDLDEETATSLRALAARQSAPVAAARPAAPAATVLSTPSRRRSHWPTLIVAAMLLLSLLFWVIHLNREPAHPEPQLAHISIDSDPRGADFSLDGTPSLHGKTPFVGQLPISAAPRTLTLTRPGYEDAVVHVTVRADLTTQVVLRPAGPPSAPPHP